MDWISHQRGQLRGKVSVRRGGKSRAGDERARLQMSLELEFAAMRVVLRKVKGDFFMNIDAEAEVPDKLFTQYL